MCLFLKENLSLVFFMFYRYITLTFKVKIVRVRALFCHEKIIESPPSLLELFFSGELENN